MKEFHIMNVEQQLYVHRACMPLSEALLEKPELEHNQTVMGFY